MIITKKIISDYDKILLLVKKLNKKYPKQDVFLFTENSSIKISNDLKLRFEVK